MLDPPVWWYTDNTVCEEHNLASDLHNTYCGGSCRPLSWHPSTPVVSGLLDGPILEFGQAWHDFGVSFMDSLQEQGIWTLVTIVPRWHIPIVV